MSLDAVYMASLKYLRVSKIINSNEIYISIKINENICKYIDQFNPSGLNYNEWQVEIRKSVDLYSKEIRLSCQFQSQYTEFTKFGFTYFFRSIGVFFLKTLIKESFYLSKKFYYFL
jgi:hypothetical protein